ncbi:hypothetical protein Syn7502_01079 [Synechococcus sp. PCC 7502]|uniref:hypothetical protein n=1 Tax=Synechococcus sp. PCC 7502 TaxID=1173263 RepID=UPI00029FF1E8|nr:hypothetical protein [Synechococcus sp. PCC 7502]AFY73189.1 hypothetical protein Syn7502_01079 [Synechococcus sp. PCC 7502]
MVLPILEWSLRIFGLFWMVGGVFALRQARYANVIDDALEALTYTKQNRLINRFLFIGSILTFCSGLGLLIMSRWVLLPQGLLIGSQLIYFTIQQQRRRQAQTEEEMIEAQVKPATINAFIVSVVVAIASVVSLILGLLR